MVDFGSRLKALRRARNLTQGELSSMLGLTKSVVSAYETSQRYPSHDILIRIAAIFGVTTDYLLGVDHRRLLDASGLSEENARLVMSLIQALKDPS